MPCRLMLGLVSSRAVHAPNFSSYTLRLRGIRFQGHIGASLEERAVRQEILVDVDVECDATSLPVQDVLEEVLSYETIACCVVDVGVAQPYRLLETYVQRVAQALMQSTPALKVRISATKKHVPTTHPVDRAEVEVVMAR